VYYLGLYILAMIVKNSQVLYPLLKILLPKTRQKLFYFEYSTRIVSNYYRWCIRRDVRRGTSPPVYLS